MTAKTSTTHPLQIAFVSPHNGSGQVGLTFCPGKKQQDAYSGSWDRDLHLDLEALQSNNVAALVSLIEDFEFEALQVESLGSMAPDYGMEWYHLPIVDQKTPGLAWEVRWAQVGPVLRGHVLAGRRVVVHCKGGLGRAGTVASRLLIELGMPPEDAISAVRAVREGAIENAFQERYVAALDRIPLPEKLAGAVLGALVGDALGVPYEFKPASQQPPLADIEMQPPPEFSRSWVQVPIGTWSDDGALLLSLLASLNECSAFDLDDFAERIIRWEQEGYMAVGGKVFDIGGATEAGIRRMLDGIAPSHAGGSSEHSNGNGALMRVLPLALWHTGSDAELVAAARESSLPTHGHLRSQLCCALYCLMARYLLDEQTQVWTRAVATMEQLYPKGTAERTELDEQVLAFPSTECRGSGYVVDSLHCARLLLEEADYETAMKRAVALGNDTDTTACIAGGLAGIRWGVRGIPPSWLARLRERNVAEREIETLINSRCGPLKEMHI